MPTTYGNDIVYCLKSHCGVRGYCRQKWVLQVQIICKFSNERTCKRNKDVQGLSYGFEGSVKFMRFFLVVLYFIYIFAKNFGGQGEIPYRRYSPRLLFLIELIW